MASDAQILANRHNAQKSTGPRTAEGKVIACQNSLRHGLTARQEVLRSESRADYDRHRSGMLAALDPVGPVESVLAEQIVSLSWRLRRSGRFQTTAIDAMELDRAANPYIKLTQRMMARALGQGRDAPEAEDEDLAFGRLVVKDFANSRVIDRLLMYERRIEHSLYRSLTEIQRLQLIRELEANGQTETIYGKRTQFTEAMKSC